MSFWTGLEAFTGHRPGAFTGMTMKDLFNNDMWDRLPQTWSGQMGTPAHLKANPMDIRTNRAGEPMTTNWYNRNAGVAPVPEEINSRNRPDVPTGPAHSSVMGGPGTPFYPRTQALKPRPNLNPIPVPGWTPPRTQAETIQETGRYYGMGDPYSGWGGYLGSAKNAHMGMGASGYRVPPVPQFDSTMADMTTVKKITDDASPNTITQTVKQKVPANPTNTLMNMGRKFVGGWQDLARKVYEEKMLRRQRGY